jgi:lysyl-tRNA synthetase class 1
VSQEFATRNKLPKLDLWPYQEARKLIERIRAYPPERPVIFESGFGPSGLPHLGTISEVLRPSYVRQALKILQPDRPSRLIVFIDDMDGLRKVPENVPNRERLATEIGKPVCRIPDPFECCPSFADHMIGLLGDFLAPVEVEYELMRSSEAYGKGLFNSALHLILAKHEQILTIVRPILREENQAAWSPFMPVCPSCDRVNSTMVTAYHPDRDTVEFSCERSFGGASGCGFKGEQSVLEGKAKVQWRVDWALRWYALAVDYELYGKDLVESARLSGEILRVLGEKPPLGFAFEMLLDEQGHKISKSVGRGVTVGQWQSYAPIEVLKYFLLLNPRRARKLFLAAIPQYVDEYLAELRAFAKADQQGRQDSPLTFVLQHHSPRQFNSDLSFGLIMNLVGALGTSDRKLIWNYLTRYDPNLSQDPETAAMAERLVDCALNFYRDFIEPNKSRPVLNGAERDQIKALVDFLEANQTTSAEEIEKAIYELGRKFYEKPGQIFPLLYRVMLGQSQGPRLGVFIRLATPERVLTILKDALATPPGA